MQNTQNIQNYYQIIKKFNRGFALNILRAIAVILVFSLVYAFSACGSAVQSGQNLQKDYQMLLCLIAIQKGRNAYDSKL